MCIRDRPRRARSALAGLAAEADLLGEIGALPGVVRCHHRVCLLYTSDAADERSSVDLGGRRIIKKKKKSGIRQLGSL